MTNCLLIWKKLKTQFCNCPDKNVLMKHFFVFSSVILATVASGFTFSNSSVTSTDSKFFVMFFCCFAVVCSYACKPARLLWPVFSWINFSGTLDAKRRDADVALREWLVKFVERLPFSNIFYIIVRKVFTQIGTLAYHTFSGSMGIFDKGRR